MKRLLLLIITVIGAAPVFAETLTNREGKSIRALVLGVEGGKVQLKTAGWKDATVELKSLSDASQRRVQEIQEAKVKKAVPPPPADNGEGIITSARARLAKAKTEQGVETIRQEELAELGNTAGLSFERRKEISDKVERMRGDAFKAVALPPGVDLVTAELREGTAKKLDYQEVCVTLKNSGAHGVSEVWAEIDTYDAAGALIKTHTKQCVFAAETPGDNLQPGKTWAAAEGRGRWVWTTGDKAKASTCKVRITKVIHGPAKR